MRLDRVVVRNFRNFELVDLELGAGVTCVIGENNVGKTNLLHAIRLAIDARIHTSARQLGVSDFNFLIDSSEASQVLISAEFTDFLDDDAACALLGQWQVDEGRARVTYRFRPSPPVRTAIENEERDATGLSIEDYKWELIGGGGGDPLEVAWNESMGGTHASLSELMDLNITLLPPLRDVESALRKSGLSPLSKLVDELELDDADRQGLVDAVGEANKGVGALDQIRDLGSRLEARVADTAGPAFKLKMGIGVSPPSFDELARRLTLLLSNDHLSDFEIARNGLGMNNIVFVSLLLEHFVRKGESGAIAGSVLLFEEPEAHLHPELQHSLLGALARSGTQTVVTTHSTHVASNAKLDSYVTLTQMSDGCTCVTAPGKSAFLDQGERRDIERYLDATRSRLLFARKVILVEGAAEQFLVPQLARKCLGIELDGHGIAVVPIYGNHFQQYVKLFSQDALPRTCAVIADGDCEPEPRLAEDYCIDLEGHALEGLDTKYVEVFACPVTFERAFTSIGSLPTIIECIRVFGLGRRLREDAEALVALAETGREEEDLIQPLHELRERVLKFASRRGKGRFAQVLTNVITENTPMPSYIEAAIRYVVE